jgi:hypothetical protein
MKFSSQLTTWKKTGFPRRKMLQRGSRTPPRAVLSVLRTQLEQHHFSFAEMAPRKGGPPSSRTMQVQFAPQKILLLREGGNSSLRAGIDHW